VAKSNRDIGVVLTLVGNGFVMIAMIQEDMHSIPIILLIGVIYAGDMDYPCVRLVVVFNAGKRAIKLYCTRKDLAKRYCNKVNKVAI